MRHLYYKYTIRIQGWITGIPGDSQSINSFIKWKGTWHQHKRKEPQLMLSSLFNFNEEFGGGGFLKSEDNLISNVIHRRREEAARPFEDRKWCTSLEKGGHTI